jgi:hypothetical protein
MPADSVSVRVSHFKVVRCLGDVRSPGHSAALSTEAVRGLASDQNTTLSWRAQTLSMVESLHLTLITTLPWTQRHPLC